MLTFFLLTTSFLNVFSLTYRTGIWNPSATGGTLNTYIASSEITGIEWGIVNSYSSVVITRITSRNGDVFTGLGTASVDRACTTVSLASGENIDQVFVHGGQCDTSSGVPCNRASDNFVRRIAFMTNRGSYHVCVYTGTRVDPPTPTFGVDMGSVSENARLTGIIARTGSIIDAIGFEFTYDASNTRGCVLSPSYPPNPSGGAAGTNLFLGDVQLIEWGIKNSFSSVIIEAYDGSGDDAYAMGLPNMIDNHCDSINLISIYQSEVITSIDTWAGTCTNCNYGTHNFVRAIRLHTNLGRSFECSATKNAQMYTYPTSSLGKSVSLEGFSWKDGYIIDGIQYQMCYFHQTSVTQTFTIEIDFGGNTGTMTQSISLVDERAPFRTANALKLACWFLDISTNIGNFGSLSEDVTLNNIGTNGNTRWNWYLNGVLGNNRGDDMINNGNTLLLRYE